MSDAPDAEQHGAPADGALDDAPSDEGLHISSLRPANRPAPAFSMRHLLNIASLVVAGILLLALAIHWLPNVLPKPTPNPHVVHAQQTLDASRPLARGAGWKLRGPDWATDIAFSADGSVGYACGHFAPEPAEFFAVYHVAENGWEMFPTPQAAPAGGSCRVAVSPIDPNDVALIISGHSGHASQAQFTSRIVRSLDGGETWIALGLSASTYITDIDWTQHALFLVAEDTSTAGTSAAPTFTLLVSRENGPLTEIPSRSLVENDVPLGAITLVSNGVTIYASINAASCSSSCTTFLESNDDGRFWAPHPSTWRDLVVFVAAARPATSMLTGWAFDEASNMLIVLVSYDGGAGWQPLPALPVSPGMGGAQLFLAPNGVVHAFCFGIANAVYVLQNGASSWRTIASLPVGSPLAVQWNGAGHAVAFWGEAHVAEGADSTSGLEYYALNAKG